MQKVFVHVVTVVYIDFRKAFDTVTHTKLIAKLVSYGISGNLLAWFQEYLNGRSHCTRIGNTFSIFLPMLSGVIQGSVIGPLLFLIFGFKKGSGCPMQFMLSDV